MQNIVNIENQLKKFIKAFNDMESSQLAPLFMDDATAFFGKGADELIRIDGKKNVVEVFETYFQKKKTGRKSQIIIEPLNKQLRVFGEIAVVTFELDDKDDFWRRRTFILQKHEGDFLILHLHASAEKINDFPLQEIYDKLVEQGGYFNYSLIVDVLSKILQGKKEVLELCIGTGNIAIRLAEAEKELSITGIDNSEKMLALLEQKLKEKKLKISYKNLSAENFTCEKKFDAIYIHSGHLIFNKNEKGLFLNAPSIDSRNKTFNSVVNHLNDSGLFIINIERWNDCTIKLLDGTIYQRTIIKETKKYGTRLHTFFDGGSGKIHIEKVERQPKYSEKDVTEALEELGFENFKNHLDMFFVCEYIKKKQ
jgi:ketosteroid isomerase-like protein